MKKIMTVHKRSKHKKYVFVVSGEFPLLLIATANGKGLELTWIIFHKMDAIKGVACEICYLALN